MFLLTNPYLALKVHAAISSFAINEHNRQMAVTHTPYLIGFGTFMVESIHQVIMSCFDYNCYPIYTLLPIPMIFLLIIPILFSNL